MAETNYDAAIDYDAVLDFDGIFSATPTGGGGSSGGYYYGALKRHAPQLSEEPDHHEVRREVERVYKLLAEEKTPAEIQERAAEVGKAFVDKPYVVSASVMPPAVAVNFDDMMRNLTAIELLLAEYQQKMEAELLAVFMLAI